jgi:hypothetical protein
MVSFIDSLTPYLVDQTNIDISGLTGCTGPVQSRPLWQHIQNMLDAVLEWGSTSGVWADANLSILCSYGFPVAGAGTPAEIVATTPIRLVPAQLLTAGGKAAFAQQLATSIQNWPAWPGSSEGGILILDVSVFTTPTGPTGPDVPLKPILELESLRLPIADIGDSGFKKGPR